MAFGVILRGFLFQCFILMSRVQGFDKVLVIINNKALYEHFYKLVSMGWALGFLFR